MAAADIQGIVDRRAAITGLPFSRNAGDFATLSIGGRYSGMSNINGLGGYTNSNFITLSQNGAGEDEDVRAATAVAEAIIQAPWTIKAMNPLPFDVTADDLRPT